ncbi:MAG: ribosome biogenesis GTPase Der [Bacteroidota bacterium]|nr:ribosome biogenesis GTPase Der [Bacteroidota bacterium]
MSNVVAIVGRPNVGKSTFFNRLVGQRKAIMDNLSGVTRDRHYGFAEWCGKYFTVIDTGGYVHGSDDIFESEIRKQVKLATDEADVILFMVDVDEGVTDLDKDFANFIRQTKKPILIVANKADTPLKFNLTGEFYGLGISDEIFPVSSQTGSGTGELLDRVLTFFKVDAPEDPNAGLPRISILGRPNVGKSSLLNVLLGVDRSIVTDIAGTTRDSIDTIYDAFGKKFVLTDTAGIRKKSAVKEDIEFYSVMRSIQAIENSDVCICMLDAERGIESQDVNIISLAVKNKKGVVIAVNKWDLIKDKDSKLTKKWEENIYDKLAPMDYIPIIFTSVVDKQRIHKILEVALEIYETKTQKISTSKLNDILLKEIENYPPPALNGQYVKVKYITQLPIKNPTFAFFCNKPKYIKESYQRFLENKIRKYFGFQGVPLTLVFREK